jgi:hypothetical protein
MEFQLAIYTINVYKVRGMLRLIFQHDNKLLNPTSLRITRNDYLDLKRVLAEDLLLKGVTDVEPENGMYHSLMVMYKKEEARIYKLQKTYFRSIYLRKYKVLIPTIY